MAAPCRPRPSARINCVTPHFARSSRRTLTVVPTHDGGRQVFRTGTAIGQTTRRLIGGGHDCGRSLTPVAATLAWRRVRGSVSVRPLQASYLLLPALLSVLLNAVTPSEIGCVSNPAGSLLEPGWLPTECLEERLVSPASTVGLSEQPTHRIVVPRVVTSRVFIRVGDIRYVGIGARKGVCPASPTGEGSACQDRHHGDATQGGSGPGIAHALSSAVCGHMLSTVHRQKRNRKTTKVELSLLVWPITVSCGS
jgi:hypothetical protein